MGVQFFPDLIEVGSFPSRTDRHVLSGTVDIDGTPVQRRIVVLHRHTFEVVASTWSRPDGTWRISHTREYPERALMVLAFDDDGVFNLVGADFVTQEAE